MAHRLRFIASTLVCSVVVLANAIANAQGAAPAQSALDPAAAEHLFREGVKLREAGNCVTAVQKFEASFRLDPMSGTMLNLAECAYSLGKIATAWASYNKAQILARQLGNADQYDYATKRLAELEPQLSWLTVSAPNPEPDLRVIRDGIEMSRAQFDVKLPIDPGKHVIVVEAPGFLARRLEINIGQRGDVQVLELPTLAPIPRITSRLASVDAATDAARQPMRPAESHRSPGPWVLGGFGATALAIGSVAGILALVDEHRLHKSCPSHAGCTNDDVRIQGRRDLEATIADIGVPLGAAAMVGAAWWWLQDNKKEPRRIGHSGVTLTVMPGTNSGALWLQGKFD